MEFNVFVSCSGCNIKTFCKEEVVEVDGFQRVVYYCEECCRYLEEVEKDWNLN